MRNFKDLKVWEKAHQMTLAIYQASAKFPSEESFGLTSQIRRAAVSIPANISEGCGRDGEADFTRFLQIAMGSANELEYHLLLAHDLSYLGEPEYQCLAEHTIEIKKMLTGLIHRKYSSTT